MRNLTIESIAVDAKNLGGLGLISTRLAERGLNESLFKLPNGLVEIDSSFDHFRDK